MRIFLIHRLTWLNLEAPAKVGGQLKIENLPAPEPQWREVVDGSRRDDLSLVALPNLVSLNGLSLLTSIQQVFIYDNRQLINYTGLKNFIPTLPGANWQASGNKYDPPYTSRRTGCTLIGKTSRKNP